MSLSRKAAAAMTALALGVTPVAAASATTTHHTSSSNKAAVKYCKAQEKKLGKAKFDKKYGKKNPMGKCVAAYAKHHGKKKA